MSAKNRNKPILRPRDQHNISRREIDEEALKVLYRLSNCGYIAYLVGGAVRDLLLGQKPKDFDVSTDAHPNQIRRLFRNCFLIGRRFRLAHIKFGDHVIETSTFRRNPPEHNPSDPETKQSLYQHSDNTFGTPSEDALRRDFTINGLFYDIKTFSVIDYVGGLKDLERGILRSIGDPNIRFREDPVRMLRAVRLSARLGFKIDRASMKAIRKHHREILNASTPRVMEETFKLFNRRSAAPAFRLLWQSRLMAILLPELEAYVDRSGGKNSPLWRQLESFDAQAGDRPDNAVKLAALYLPLFEEIRKESDSAEKKGGGHALTAVLHETLDPISQRLKVPRAVRESAAHLLEVQPLLATPPAEVRGNKPPRLPRLLNVADALILARIKAAAEDGDPAIVEQWRKLLPDRKPPANPRSGCRRRRGGRPRPKKTKPAD